mgnify:CR=1 FL=1
MKIDDLLVKVAADFPIKQEDKIDLKEDEKILSLDQAPQLLSLFSPKEITWDYNSIIIGPDGTQIETKNGKNDKLLYFLSPVYEPVAVGWDLKINTKSIINMIYDLLPCKEGESYFNPSFWPREDIEENKKVIMDSGEINEKLRPKNEKGIEFYENELLLDTGYVNPLYTYLNPFFISQSKKYEGKSEFFSITLKETYTLVGENKLEIKNELGKIKATTKGKLAFIKTSSWKEARPYEISWNLKNKIEKLDCKTEFPISLYKIYPSGIIPFFFKYNNNNLILGLLNLNEVPVITNLILAARIEEAYILSPQGQESEKLNTEFDRIKIPIKRFGIIFIRLKIRKLLESFLKRKIITS